MLKEVINYGKKKCCSVGGVEIFDDKVQINPIQTKPVKVV